MQKQMKCVALIVAAGRGSRFGEGVPKQYHSLAGEMVLTHTIRAFLNHSMIMGVKVVIHKDDAELYADAIANIKQNKAKLYPFCFGGKERQDSVRQGLISLESEIPDVVLIHDAARPFVDERTISDTITQVREGHGVIAALPVNDTIKRVGDNAEIEGTVDRKPLWRAQTPQTFMYRDILTAHMSLQGQSLTDDAAVAEANGVKVAVVKGSERNVKITTLEDLEMANKQLAKVNVRVGMGFDVHAFCEGDSVNLCGVKMPFNKSLLGHSDADVALHALTDAILGAVGGGDIGLHFPPSDNRWKGADSVQFLVFANNMAKQKGFSINNVDVTIICEAPKLGSFRETMVKRLAELLEIDESMVNVKGTTTERLGFTGRGEGIAVEAVVSVS